MIEPESSDPGGELHAWAERLADALRSEDADAFIAVYDLLLDDPARYDDEQVELVKALARQISDPAGEAVARSQSSAPPPRALARDVALLEVPAAAGDLRDPPKLPTASSGASEQREGVARARCASTTSSAAVGAGGDIPPRRAESVSTAVVAPSAHAVRISAPVTSAKVWRDVGTQTDVDARVLPARDAVLLMLGRRWADACLIDQDASDASGSAPIAVCKQRTRRRRQCKLALN